MKKPVSKTQKALNLWAIILIIWSIYRANFHMPDWFDEIIAKPLIFVLPVYYYITKIDKEKFLSAISFKPKSFFKDILIGLAIGFIFIVSAIAANYLKTNKPIFSIQSISISRILITCLLALVTGISEEILSRGFVLKKLYEESKNIMTSSFFASILFFFLHVPMLFTNLKITGNLLLMFMATDIALSLSLSFLFLARSSILLPILIHAFYNIVIALFI